ncbi:hypothetical protein [uncultured Clostridium sp.]|jgi:hypothetical protein|uniref:hypothetical protein n=1 Tax=uncultured Clostridium sp. TaxID=59620 RepID=UPI002601D789|nr:hypothetical protein [uncultured Clostridium sp.]
MSINTVYKILKILSFIGVAVLVLIGILATIGIIPANSISLLTIIVTGFVVAPIYYRKIKGID